MDNRSVRAVACGLALCATTAVWAAPEGKPCSAEPTDMLIEYGDVISCEISPVGDMDVFRFEGQEGEKVVAVAARLGAEDVCLEMRGPAPGDPPVVPGGCGPHVRLEATLPSSGLFTLRVTQRLSGPVVPYTLTLERLAPPSPAAQNLCPNCTITGSIDPTGDLDVFSFTGAAGDDVILHSTRQAGGYPCLALFGPAGVQVGGACGPTARLDLRLEEGGMHTVLLSEQSNDSTLDYSLYFECFGSCGPTPALLCEVEMSQPEYSIGNTLALAKLRLANHGPSAVPLEWKLWMSIPGYGDFGMLDYRFTISKGVDQVFGPISFGQVTPSWPVGNYEVGCRFLEPATGRMRAVGHAPFAIQ